MTTTQQIHGEIPQLSEAANTPCTLLAFEYNQQSSLRNNGKHHIKTSTNWSARMGPLSHGAMASRYCQSTHIRQTIRTLDEHGPNKEVVSCDLSCPYGPNMGLSLQMGNRKMGDIPPSTDAPNNPVAQPKRPVLSSLIALQAPGRRTTES